MGSLISRLAPHLHSLLSGPSGRISSSRTLMVIAFFFSIIVLSVMLWMMCHVHDPATLAIWLDHFGDVGKVLLGLVAIPYAANKASASVSEIIGAIRKRD